MSCRVFATLSRSRLPPAASSLPLMVGFTLSCVGDRARRSRSAVEKEQPQDNLRYVILVGHVPLWMNIDHLIERSDKQSCIANGSCGELDEPLETFYLSNKLPYVRRRGQ
jgi:hypothetical protein